MAQDINKEFEMLLNAVLDQRAQLMATLDELKMTSGICCFLYCGARTSHLVWIQTSSLNSAVLIFSFLI